MRNRLLWVGLNILAVLVIMGRLGNALYGQEGFWLGLLKLYLPVGGEQIGADAESLLEDWLVFVVARHNFWRSSKSHGEPAQ